MKTGNTRQAAILAAVAVGAVAFLAIRLLGIGSDPVRIAAAADPQVAGAAPSSSSDLPLLVVGNPFSHSKLAHRRTDEPGEQRPISVSGIIGLPEIGGGIQIRPESGSETPTDPEENAGSNRDVEQAPSQLVLSAILRVEQPVALISLNGEDSKSFVSGQLVARGIRVVAIGSDFALVRIGSKEHRLSPGSSVVIAQELAS